jgi:hypothetical protein
MRIWDIDPSLLCRQHLLGEHRELHGLWNILTTHGGVGGYSRHPETIRWVGKLPALRSRHELIVQEMARRGYNHASSLIGGVYGDTVQSEYVPGGTPEEQLVVLRTKGCKCLCSHAERPCSVRDELRSQNGAPTARFRSNGWTQIP